jgi:flagellar motor protein MotB
VAYLVKAPRVGRSQGAVIFWGLVSAFFASAFCYYYLENRSNEEKNRTLFDQVMNLQNERDSLNSDRQKMEAAASDTDKQLRDRQEFLQEKETKLAQEESDLETMGTQTQSQSTQSSAQAAGVKKFDDAVRKLVAQEPNADVVVRAGRPVLRLPSSIFFDQGEAQLKPDGRTVLNQVAAGASGAARFELRVETFTDSEGETETAASVPVGSQPPAPSSGAAKAGKTPAVDSWTLTAERAAAIAHYLRDSGPLPFQDVVATGRADFQPIDPGAGHARNRRVEITIAPVPATFHAPEPKTAHAKPSSHHASPANANPASPDSSANTGSP